MDNTMHPPQISLDLLPFLSELLHTRSVTKTACAFGIAQPAVTRKLQQLRVVFNDDLLVFRGNHGQLTELAPLARSLIDPLSRILAEIAVLGTRESGGGMLRRLPPVPDTGSGAPASTAPLAAPASWVDPDAVDPRAVLATIAADPRAQAMARVTAAKALLAPGRPTSDAPAPPETDRISARAAEILSRTRVH